MREEIIKVLSEVFVNLGIPITNEEIDRLIEIPPRPEIGDYAFPCFSLSKNLKMGPEEIAIKIREKIVELSLLKSFEDIKTVGPYINFFINKVEFAKKVISEIVLKKENYGKSSIGKGKKSMVEFPSPNTNKPLHLGHLRNMAIGESISRILEYHGEKVIRANLYNDRGVHICQAMLAYKKWGKEKTPNIKKMKGDHFVGYFYVLFNKKKTKKLEEEARKMLKKWEEGDKETMRLWRIMNKWAINGINKTYETFGIRPKINFFESEIYRKGKDIVQEGLRKGIFEKTEEGGIIINLEEEGLGKKYLLRNDGTSIYITQDLALAKIKFEKYSIDKSFYIVAREQEHHFNVLFYILKKLGFSEKEMKHLSYGMVLLPEGKIKSREGLVVEADDLIEKVRKLAEKEITKRTRLSKSKLNERSKKIALASIKYMLLKSDIKKDLVFNPKESISFDGNTGAYILYSYARANSIIKKIRKINKIKIKELNEKEIEIIKELSLFPNLVLSAYRSLNPSLIANYSYRLSKLFNEFYNSYRVLGSENEVFRIYLVKTFKQTIKNSLYLLGIETVEEM